MEAVGVKLEGNRITGVRTSDWKLLKRQSAKPVLYKLNAVHPPDEKHNLYQRNPEVARALEEVLEGVEATESDTPSGMTAEEESVVEQHLRDLGYL